MGQEESASAVELEQVRARASREAKLGEGFRVDEAVAARVVRMFPSLELKPGLKLVTLTSSDGADGNGWTYALPVGARVPRVEEIVAGPHFPVPPPPAALPDFMDAVAGDGSLRSFIEASILRREVEELGAVWHGEDWRTHTLLANGLDPRMPELGAPRKRERLVRMGEEMTEWEWLEDPPRDWEPQAERLGSTVIVTFNTASALGVRRLVRHSDVYEAGRLRVATREPKTIAQGGFGFVA